MPSFGVVTTCSFAPAFALEGTGLESELWSDLRPASWSSPGENSRVTYGNQASPERSGPGRDSCGNSGFLLEIASSARPAALPPDASSTGRGGRRQLSLDRIAKAIAKKVFTDHAFVKPPDKKGYSIEKVMDSPVALWQDCADSRGEPSHPGFLLHQNPSGDVAQITKWVCAKPRKDFQVALTSPLSSFLYDALAARLVAAIREQRHAR